MSTRASSGVRCPIGRARMAVGAVAALLLSAAPVGAVTIELKDVAPDRIERQIAAAEGRLPLAGAPDVAYLKERLAEKGAKIGDPVFIRVFKAESELEVWLAKDGRFEHFATYPVCQWSGTIGPKEQAGDKQTPEGFYTVSRRQLHRSARHPRSLNLGFPNVFDKSLSRTGNYILVHGGCASVGCFAMTDTLVDEIFKLTEAAIKSGQDHVPVHVFPFRMTEDNLAAHDDSPWNDFWRNLKDGYDHFETTRVPPRVNVCEKRYVYVPQTRVEARETGPLGDCGDWFAAARRLTASNTIAPPPLPLRKPQPVTTAATVTEEASEPVTSARDPLARVPGRSSESPLPQRAEDRQARASSPATKCSGAPASCVDGGQVATPVRARAVMQSRPRGSRSVAADMPAAPLAGRMALGGQR